MDCPRCKAEMFIDRADYIALHDDTPDEQTEVMHVSICKCRNKNCADYNKEYNGGFVSLPMSRQNRVFCSSCGLLLYEGDEPKDQAEFDCPKCKA